MMENITFNVSGINVSDALTQQFYGRQDFVMTTQDLLDVCGAFDQNALVAAILGLVLSVGFMFYLGRWRSRIKDEKHKVIVDKAFLTTIALCFVIVIVRVLRGG